MEAPLQPYLAVAYLLCRVADNIEDCGQSVAQNQERFAEFRFLQVPQNAAIMLAQWECEPWPLLTEQERRMMVYQMGSCSGKSIPYCRRRLSQEL